MEFLIYKRHKCPGCRGEKKITKTRHGIEETYDCPMCEGRGYKDELVPLKEAKSELRRILQVQ